MYSSKKVLLIFATTILFVGLFNVISAQGTCNSLTFSSAFDLCCNGVKQSKIGKLDPKCCGFKVYDAKFQICCYGVVQSTSGILRPGCCRYNVYDTAFRQCCFGTIQFPSIFGCRTKTNK